VPSAHRSAAPCGGAIQSVSGRGARAVRNPRYRQINAYTRSEFATLNRLAFLLSDIARLYMRYFERCMVALKLTLLEYKVLICLSQNEGATQSLLADLVETDLSTLGRIIDHMEKHGLIERHQRANDRRAHRLQLGPVAETALMEIMLADDRVRNTVLARVATVEQLQFMNLLEHVHANLLRLAPIGRDGVKAVAMIVAHREMSRDPATDHPSPTALAGQESNERHG
jgi:DNA-binding MarR family transcriptional regulator